jgi:hypothetical protein
VHRYKLNAVLLLTLAALAAGCASSYSKHDFVARADGICGNAVRAIRSLAPPKATGGSVALSALASYFGKLVPIVASESAQLHALRRPGGSSQDRATLDRYLTALSQAVSEYRAVSAAAKRGDRQGLSEAEAVLLANPVTALATRYGLTACATPGTTAV